MPSKPAPSKRPDGTLNRLVKALGIGKRRVSVLLAEGMPDTVAEALEWRSKRENSSTVEELRRQRILLIQEQRRRAEIENAERLGKLIDAGQAQASATRCFSVARGSLLKLTNDLPGKLVGLDAADMQAIIREDIIQILTELSDETSGMYQPPGTI